MGSQVREETAVIDNANRMYTEEEDQKILAKWWNKKLRPELARELGRTEAALAQRFYAILKKKGIDPKTYREKMREQNGRYLQSVTPASGRSWTRDEDIILWRSVKAGEDFVDIAARLPGRTIDECRERYEVLRQANAAADTSGQASEAFRPEVPQTAEAEDERKQEIQKSAEDGQAAGARIDIHDKDSEDAGDFLEVLRQFPQQAETLSHRMNDIERDIEYIKGSLQFTLEHLAKGLQNIANYLVGQEQDFTAFEKIRQENQALRTQLAALKQRMENEKKELRKVYNELEFWLGEFLEMRKIEKVANLGELIPKLKYSYDKFGVLLQIEKEA
ncbi:MAG TPA: hypothetical protein GXX47_00590 [Firmicutes bacterium]|nr:hypothetical protein [Bacillota bacterium]